MDLLLHPDTKEAVIKLVDSDAHAFMLVGPPGSGKQAVARHIASQMLGTDNLATAPGFKFVAPDKGSIGIDAVRTLLQFMRLKSTGKARIRRVVIVEDAHSMTLEAQNAFLKLLEEPPTDTRIIMTVASGQGMLPTIHSRVQSFRLQAPDKDQLESFFMEQGMATSDIQRACLLSGGQIGLMSALLRNETDHPLLSYVDRARQFLGLTTFERLASLDSFAKTRDELTMLLQVLKRMSTTAFEQAALSRKYTKAQHWHKIRQAVMEHEALLNRTPNVKLLLTNLILNL